MTPAKSSGDRTSLTFGIFQNTAESLLLAGIVLYVTGSSYFFAYYQAFGVKSREIEISLYDILLFNINILAERWWVAASLTVVIGGLFLFFWEVGRNSMRHLNEPHAPIVGPRVKFLLLLATVAMLPALSTWMMRIARDEAYRDMRETSSTLPFVSIAAKKDTLPAELFDADKVTQSGYVELGYKMLGAGKDVYYFFKPIANPRDSQQSVAGGNINVNVIMIPKNDIRGVGILVGLPARSKGGVR